MTSKVNLELKYFCKDFEPIRGVLKKLGAKRVAIKKQEDYFFNLPGKSNTKAPARLKLRKENGTEILVFYRRPAFAADTATNSEVTLLPVKDSELGRLLTNALGVRALVEKKRELWKKGNTVFHLDTVQDVGTIFEIEVWSTQKTISEDKKKFIHYRSLLLPHLGKVVKGSNEDLVPKLLH